LRLRGGVQALLQNGHVFLPGDVFVTKAFTPIERIFKRIGKRFAPRKCTKTRTWRIFTDLN